jgi:hypothetical protein
VFRIERRAGAALVESASKRSRPLSQGKIARLYRCDDLREDQCWLRAGLVCVGHDRGQRADCRRRVALAPGDESGARDLNKLVIEPGRQI